MTSFRISSDQFTAQSVSTLQQQQARLVDVQNQLATGRRVEVAADDPSGFARAVGLDDSLRELEQFQANTQRLSDRLALGESVLGRAGDALLRVKDLTLAANNATQNDNSRAAIVHEIKGRLDELVALANQQDGEGRFLFAGSADGATPFVVDGTGVRYVGDQTPPSVQVAASQSVSGNAPGSEIFARIPDGDGFARVTAGSANTGTARIDRTTVIDRSAISNGPFQVAFAGDQYTVTDGAGATIETGDYSPGESIAVGGVEVRIDGQPNDGDVLDVRASTSRSVFERVQDVIQALETPATTPSDQARLQNELFVSIGELDEALAHLTNSRAAVGSRMQQLDAIDQSHEAASIQLQSTVSEIRDVDPYEAISQLQQQLANLEIAQQAFVRLQNLSLFRLLG